MSTSEERALAQREGTEIASADPYERKYMRGEGQVLYRAKQRAPAALTAVFGGLTLATAIPVLLGTPGAWLSMALTMPVMFVLWVLFAVLRVTVSEGSVKIQYGLFGPTIPIAAIESAELTTYSWVHFGGWGIRRGPKGEWLYNMPGDGGKAVRVVWRDAKGRRKVTLIGSKEAESLARSVARARRALPGAESESKALPSRS
ncbi:MAG: hypothetical protein AAGF11_47690 [Myxococcota bacterium]